MANHAPFGTDEWLEQARAELMERPCYRCEEIGVMSLGWEFVVHPLGTWSLAGMQDKTSASKVLIMSHKKCGLRGRITEDN